MQSTPPPKQPSIKIEYVIVGAHQDNLREDTYQLLSSWPPEWLEEYFKNLTKITTNVRQTLPSGNKFMITYEWISFLRNWRTEHWKIKAKNKGAWIHIKRVQHTPLWWRLWITATKYWMPFSQDPQTLEWHEIVAIFKQIEDWKTYTRPAKKPDWTLYKLILEVHRE